MAKKSRLTVQERNMLQARAPSSTDVDMANTEIPLDQVLKVKHKDIQFDLKRFSGRGTRGFKVHIEVQTYSAQEHLADGCDEEKTTTAESYTTRELSDIKRRLDKHREDIDETHAMVTYTGNAQFTFEAMIEKFDDRLEEAAKKEEEHRLQCDRELLKMYCSLDDMSSSGPIEVARDVRLNEAQSF
ncbi:hypothetical protein FDENT_12962, partial [Fusarium denticulatum]